MTTCPLSRVSKQAVSAPRNNRQLRYPCSSEVQNRHGERHIT